MITIRNTQRKVAIDLVKLQGDAECILNKLRYANYDLGILIVNDAAMRAYNKQYRDKDKPTDILSFPYHTDLQPGQRIKPSSPDDKNLGDIIIDAPYVVREAQELGVGLDDRLRVLLVHGIYHLLGYDHMTDAEYALMHKKEKAMLKYLALHLGVVA